MDSPAVLYPPNKPFDRDVTVFDRKEYEYFFSLDFNQTGQALLTASSVAASAWFGVTYLFDNHEKLLTPDNYTSEYYDYGTISDGKFFGKEYIVISKDNKDLTLLMISDGSMVYLDSYKWHDLIEEIAVWQRCKKLVLASDKSVVVINVEGSPASIAMEREYRNYHTEMVTSVDINQSSTNTFASVSLDKKACLWDDRTDNIATVLYENEFNTLRSISWNPIDSNQLAVGSSAGDVYLLDVRQPGHFQSRFSCCPHSIHRLKYDEIGRQIAVCGDYNGITVLEAEAEGNLKLVYKDHEHSGIVRGLAWYDNVLYSCGMDKTVLKHCI